MKGKVNGVRSPGLRPNLAMHQTPPSHSAPRIALSTASWSHRLRQCLRPQPSQYQNSKYFGAYASEERLPRYLKQRKSAGGQGTIQGHRLVARYAASDNLNGSASSRCQLSPFQAAAIPGSCALGRSPWRRRGGVPFGRVRPLFQGRFRYAARGMPTVYKVLTAKAWQLAQARGVFEGSPDDARDGFLHFSTAEQLAQTLERHFAQAPELLLLYVRTDAVSDPSAWRWEPSRGGALFPHLYATLPVAAVHRVEPLALDARGSHQLPELER